MKSVINFLRQLYGNNCTEWFHAHRPEYEAARDRFNQFATKLLAELIKMDDSLAGLELKDCTYRINRDIRFSADKSPYKTHFCLFAAPGGKKSMKAGYYFHLSVGGDDYPDANMIAVGNYCYDKRVVEIVREDMEDEGEKFDAFVRTASEDGLELDYHNSLKKVPKAFADSPYKDYARLKSYCLQRFMSPSEVEDADALLARLVAICRKNKPFVEYITKVVDYTMEEDVQ
ncbi:MAG: DUF2461 domain-containing protein [Paludibacteraceae bacterium]|nr:DUF2461 domain-containing protein [Paludibacteraceae bacterium]